MNQVLNDQVDSSDKVKQSGDQLLILKQQWQSVIVGQQDVCVGSAVAVWD